MGAGHGMSTKVGAAAVQILRLDEHHEPKVPAGMPTEDLGRIGRAPTFGCILFKTTKKVRNYVFSLVCEKTQ